MSRDELRPGQAARASRIAIMLANVVRELKVVQHDERHPYHWDHNAVVRGVALHLKAGQLRPRDLDQPNGQDAIGAIVATQPIKYWERLAIGQDGIVLGKIWLCVVQRARQELRKDRAVKSVNVRDFTSLKFTSSLTSLEPVSIVKR